MPTQEDRLAALERKVAMLELLRSRDERNAEESIPPVQAQNLREINENMTMLLGVVGSQGRDIKTIQEDVSSIKDRLGSVENRLGGVERRLDRLETKFDQHTALLTQILARLPEKPHQ